jgi:hypothetical protein
MGESAKAKIFYGFDLYSEDMVNSPEIAALVDEYLETNDDSSVHDFFECWGNILKDQLPSLKIGCHGYIEEPTYFIYVNDSKIETDWDYGATSIPIAKFVTARTSAWDKDLQKFCDHFGIPMGVADWKLAAYLG